MREINLRSWDMGKRRRSHRDLRPETTTGARWTNIPDAAARARFALGDRVAWDEGDRILLGAVESYIEGEQHLVIVRLENGQAATWPTVSARFRRVSLPLPSAEADVSVAETVERHPLDGGRTPTEPERVASGYYESVDLSEPSGDLTEIFDATVPDDNRRTRRGR